MHSWQVWAVMYLVKKDGKPNASDVGLNNSGAVQGAEYLQKMVQGKNYSPKGIIGESGGPAADGLFNEGKSSFYHEWPMGVPSNGKEQGLIMALLQCRNYQMVNQ